MYSKGGVHFPYCGHKGLTAGKAEGSAGRKGGVSHDPAQFSPDSRCSGSSVRLCV